MRLFRDFILQGQPHLLPLHLASFHAYASSTSLPICLQGSIPGSWLAITWTGFPPASLCSIARPQRLFNQTPRGADASALLYSLVQTAVANNLEPFDYLKYLFTEIPKLGRHSEPEALDQFLPWNLTEIIEPLNQAA